MYGHKTQALISMILQSKEEIIIQLGKHGMLEATDKKIFKCGKPKRQEEDRKLLKTF